MSKLKKTQIKKFQSYIREEYQYSQDTNFQNEIQSLNVFSNGGFNKR